jgi:hypothetical protein
MKKISGLYYCEDAGEGDVKMPKKFMDESPLFRVDVLGDWIHDLTRLHEEATKEMHEEWAVLREKSKTVEPAD